MWAASKRNLCGDCLVKCHYVDYDRDRAVAEITVLTTGKNADMLPRSFIMHATVGSENLRPDMKPQVLQESTAIVKFMRALVLADLKGVSGAGDYRLLIPAGPT